MDFNALFNTPDNTELYDPSDIEANKIWTGISYLGTGLFFFLPLIVNSNSSFGKYHANQALVLFIFSIVANVAAQIVGMIPVVGSIFCWVIRLVCLVLMVCGIVNGFQGKAKSLPVIGELFQLIK